MIKIIRSSIRTVAVMSLSLACTLPVLAQSTTGSSGTGMNSSNNSTPTGQTTGDAGRDGHSDYGWIGLVGLVGLLGLRRKPEHRVDVNRTTSTSR